MIISCLAPKIIPRTPSPEPPPAEESDEQVWVTPSQSSGVNFSNNNVVPMETLKAKAFVQIEDSKYKPLMRQSQQKLSAFLVCLNV